MIPKRISLVAGAVLLAGWLVWTSVFVLPVEKQAVVLRQGEIARVLGAGLHWRIPFLEEVVAYDAYRVRQSELNGTFTLASCPANIKLIYSIDDVVTFHKAGASYDAVQKVSAQVPGILDSVQTEGPELADTAGKQLTQSLAGALQNDGLRIQQATVDLGDCGPKKPRLEERREPLPSISSAGSPGTERAPFGPRIYKTSDGVKVEISGAVATFDITDTKRFEACFRDLTIAIPRVTVLVEQNLNRAVEQQSLQTIGAIAGTIPALIKPQESCGIAIKAVDYSPATLTRIIEINCDTTPDAQECQSASTFTAPRLILPKQPQ